MTLIDPTLFAPVAVNAANLGFPTIGTVQPFSPRAGIGYQDLLETLRVYVTNDLFNAVTALGDPTPWNTSMTNLIDAIDTALNTQQVNVQADLTTVLDQIAAGENAALNNATILSALQSAGSAVKGYLDGLYAPKADHTALRSSFGKLVYNVLDFGAKCDGSTDDTAAWQAAIDALIINSSISDGAEAAVNVPVAGNGGTIRFPVGVSKVTTLTIKDGIEIEGSGRYGAELLVSGTIKYQTVFATNFTSVWGPAIRRLRIRGALGTETLISPAAITSPTANTEHFMVEGRFEDLELEHAAVGISLRGWNNVFRNVHFRGLGIGAVLQEAAMATGSTATPNAGCDDNLFMRCDFNNCAVGVKIRGASGTQFIACAFYQSTNLHVWLGENANDTKFLGGRLEDAANGLALLDGANIVNVGGITYQATTIHTADSTNQPGTGANWQANWKVVSGWSTWKTWVSGRQYFPQAARNNKFDGVNLHRGPSMTLSTPLIALDGDLGTVIEDCESGTTEPMTVTITARSVTAFLRNNMNILGTFTGPGTDTHIEVSHSYGSNSLNVTAGATFSGEVKTNGNLNVNGNLNHQSTGKVGFFGTAPASKQTLPATPALADVVYILRQYGLG